AATHGRGDRRRVGSRGAASELLSIGAALLVGGSLWPTARARLWHGGTLHVHDRAAQRPARRAFELRDDASVSGFRAHHAAVGDFAAGRSAAWRADHVDSGRRGFHRRSEEHTSELQSPYDLVCRLLLEKKNK